MRFSSLVRLVLPAVACAALAACGTNTPKSDSPSPGIATGSTSSPTATDAAELPPADPCTLLTRHKVDSFVEKKQRPFVTREQSLGVYPGGVFFGCDVVAHNVMPQLTYGYFITPDAFAIADGRTKGYVFPSQGNTAADKAMAKVLRVFNQKKVRVNGLGDDAFVSQSLFDTSAYSKVGTQTVRMQLSALYHQNTITGAQIGDAVSDMVVKAIGWQATAPKVDIQTPCPTVEDARITAITGPVAYARGSARTGYAYCTYIGTNGTTLYAVDRVLSPGGLEGELANFKPRAHMISSGATRKAGWESSEGNGFDYIDVRGTPGGGGEEFILGVSPVDPKIPAAGDGRGDLALARELSGAISGH